MSFFLSVPSPVVGEGMNPTILLLCACGSVVLLLILACVFLIRKRYVPVIPLCVLCVCVLCEYCVDCV